MNTPAPPLPPSRRLGPECISDLRLDQLSLGELDAAASARVQAHLATCPSCAQAAAGLREQRDAFLARVDVPTWAAQLQQAGQRRSRPWRWLWAPLGLSASLAGALLLVRPAPTPIATDGLRAKGGFGLTTYVKFKDDDRGALHLGEPLRAGDRVQFHVSTDRPGNLVVVSVDDQGAVSTYHPTGSAGTSLPAGKDQALPSAIELDESLGQETVVAVLCESAVPVQTVVDAAKQAAQAARAQGLAASALGPLGLPCAEARTTLRKVPAGSPR